MENPVDQHRGFTIELTPEWRETPPGGPGGVCFRSSDGAVVAISSCEPASSVFLDPTARTGEIYKELCAEFPGARQNWDAFRPIPGGINIASGQVLGLVGAAGLISILDGGVEYTIRYTIPITSPFSAIKKVNDLVLSFRIRSQPDAELFVDPQKLSRGRRRWWHFWRWLGH